MFDLFIGPMGSVACVGEDATVSSYIFYLPVSSYALYRPQSYSADPAMIIFGVIASAVLVCFTTTINSC